MTVLSYFPRMRFAYALRIYGMLRLLAYEGAPGGGHFYDSYTRPASYHCFCDGFDILLSSTLLCGDVAGDAPFSAIYSRRRLCFYPPPLPALFGFRRAHHMLG